MRVRYDRLLTVLTASDNMMIERLRKLLGMGSRTLSENDDTNQKHLKR